MNDTYINKIIYKIQNLIYKIHMPEDTTHFALFIVSETNEKYLKLPAKAYFMIDAFN